MLNYRIINFNSIKLNLLNILLILFVSCNNFTKKKCNHKTLNTAYLTKYLILTDSCNTLNGFPKVNYFVNDKLFMSGFSERNDKRGNWTFYNKNEERVISGLFKESQPQGKWVFKNFDTITWKTHKDFNKGYQIVFPNDWKAAESEEGFSYLIFDENTKSFEDYNLKVVITSLNLDSLKDSVKALYYDNIEEFKKTGYKNITYKKVDISKFNEVYEIQYKEIFEGIEYQNTELLYSYKDRFYLLSFSIRDNTDYNYTVIKEIIDTSFKVFKN